MRRSVEPYGSYNNAYPDENKIEEDHGPNYTIALADAGNFKNILDNIPIVVVYVWAPWCRACKPSNGLFLRLAQAWLPDIQRRHIIFIKDDIEYPQTIHKTRVEVVPTFFIYHDGREVGRVVGNEMNQVNEILRQWIRIPCVPKNTTSPPPPPPVKKTEQSSCTTGRCPLKASPNGPNVDGVS